MARIDDLMSVDDFRRLAKRRLPKSIFEFVDGGALDQLTLAANRDDFDRIRLVPRTLADVSEPDTSVRLWDQQLVICPMGSCKLLWPEADIAIAQAAAERGIPYTLSTMSTTSIERMARSVHGPLWFQLYMFKDYDFNRTLLERAHGCGYSTLVVTVDLKAAGKREMDLRNHISLPFKPTLRQFGEGVIRPGWAIRFLRGGLPEFENIRGYQKDGGAGLTLAARAAMDLDRTMGLEGFRCLRDWWKGRLVVKGVLDPSDASEFVDHGADGVWISNHGGRQLDSAVSSIAATPGIREAVGHRVPLLLDSGVRRGLDVIKARANGISAVGIGRAVAFGATAGKQGVGRVLDILIEELRNGMQLLGAPTFRNINCEAIAACPVGQPRQALGRRT